MSFKIIGKYIKNVKFGIPNPKSFFLLSKNIANYKVNIDIKSNQIKEKIIEVETSLSLLPNKESFEKIDTKIVYSAIIELESNLSDKIEIEKIILVNVPEQIYPELRKIFILSFESSGFKDVNINEMVNFQELYNKRKTQ